MRRMNILNKASNYLLDFHLDEYKEFIEFNNGHFIKANDDLNKEYDEIQKYIKENKHKDDPAFLSAIEDRVIDNAHSLRNYETIFRTSVIIQVYTFMEIELKRFCRAYSNIHGLRESYNEAFSKGKESDFKRAKKFIKEHLDLNLSSSPYWHFICLLSSLRNHLVHSGNILTKKDKHFADIQNLSNKNFILEEHQFYFEILFEDNKFLFKMIDNIRAFFEILSDY